MRRAVVFALSHPAGSDEERDFLEIDLTAPGGGDRPATNPR